MLTLNHIIKANRLMNQTGGDNRDFMNPHYKNPSLPGYYPELEKLEKSLEEVKQS